MEDYKTIPFEDNYEVSSEGNVRNANTKNIKNLRYDKYGYLRVTLYPSGKTYSAHRLVMLTWEPEGFKEGLQVDHLNTKRDDNRLSNLEWVTPQENVSRIKYNGWGNGSSNSMSKIDESIAFDIKYDFESTIKELCLKYNISDSMVETIRRRECWKSVFDVTLEKEFLLGNLKYKKGVTANLSKEDGRRINKDLIEGKLSTKELTEKFFCSKATVCRRRRKLGL